MPLLAEIDAEQGRRRDGDATAAMSPTAQRAIATYVAELEAAVAYFGEPSAPVTMRDVYNFETRFRALIHPAQYSATWMRHYLGKYHHEREKYATRSPPPLIYQRGMFDEAAAM